MRASLDALDAEMNARGNGCPNLNGHQVTSPFLSELDAGLVRLHEIIIGGVFGNVKDLIHAGKEQMEPSFPLTVYDLMLK